MENPDGDRLRFRVAFRSEVWPEHSREFARREERGRHDVKAEAVVVGSRATHKTLKTT